MEENVDKEVTSSNVFIEKELKKKLEAISTNANADILTIIAGMQNPIDDVVRDALEDIAASDEKQEDLLVLLETNGGSIEVVERIVNAIRHHYSGEVSFLVPNFAMSAGTVLVMSGDRILMDYYSVLGPIDPQVLSRARDRYVPALGYLEKFDDLIKKAKKGEMTEVEMAFFLDKFDPAELHQFEQARDLSVELLKKWLVQYKFKNWTVTATKKTKVTDRMREDRANQIAKRLNDVKRWKSHGRGLSKEVIERELELQIEDFGNDIELNKSVRAYYRFLQDYMMRVGHQIVIQTSQRYFGV